MIGVRAASVPFVSGHTQGHIDYEFETDRILFSGDGLFAHGCGRLVEGSAEQMWTSWQKRIALPDDTTVYCAHEYTQSNANFALTIEPQNSELQQRAQQINQLRSENKPTVPSNLGVEKRTNPFLRPMSRDVRETLGMPDAPLVDVFAETRLRKDNF